MEKQQNKNYEQALNQYRKDIDNIDEKIISLLKDRMKIVECVKEIKSTNGEKFFIKPSRETDMIKSLIAKSEGSLPQSLIINIWRKIITASNMLEQNIKIALHNPQRIADYTYLVREYYSDLVPIITHDSINNVVSEIEKNNTQIAIFPLPTENENADFGEYWWINLANNRLGLKVFVKIPFLQSTNINLVALAIKKAEKSSSDKSLFCIEIDNNFSKQSLITALKDSAINAKILSSAKLKQVDNITFYLVEANGFFDENSEELKKFSKSKIKPFAKILGHYPSGL